MEISREFRLYFFKLRRFINALFSKKSRKRFLEQLYNPDQSDGRKAFSAAFGIFMGIIPIWGLQTIAAVFLAMLFKLNKALVVLFSQVSFPPLFPLVVLLSYRFGRYWIVNAGVASHAITMQNAGNHLQQYIYGSISLALISAFFTGVLTYIFLKAVKGAKQARLKQDLKRSSDLAL